MLHIESRGGKEFVFVGKDRGRQEMGKEKVGGGHGKNGEKPVTKRSTKRAVSKEKP